MKSTMIVIVPIWFQAETFSRKISDSQYTILDDTFHFIVTQETSSVWTVPNLKFICLLFPIQNFLFPFLLPLSFFLIFSFVYLHNSLFTLSICLPLQLDTHLLLFKPFPTHIKQTEEDTADAYWIKLEVKTGQNYLEHFWNKSFLTLFSFSFSSWILASRFFQV